MVHVHNEIAPVRIVINKGHAIYVELEKRLKPSVDVLEILRAPHNFDYFKSLGNHLTNLRLVIPRQLWFR